MLQFYFCVSLQITGFELTFGPGVFLVLAKISATRKFS